MVRFSGPPLASGSNSGTSDVELWHLTGACSLNSLVLGFVHTSIKPSYLPWTVYTNGKAYSPDCGQVNCLDMLTLTADSSEYMMHNDRPLGSIDEILGRGQAYLDELKTQVERFALRCSSDHSLYEDELRRELSHSNKSVDQIFIDYLKLFVYVFKEFEIPMRFHCLNANQLKSSESFLVQVQAYLPSAQAFVTVSQSI